MTTGRSCRWRGASGKSFPFDIYPLDGDFPNAPGNYIFARESPIGWNAVYIEETFNLRGRLTPLYTHPKYDCAMRRGMTHIHIHVNTQGADDRKREEDDIVSRYRPECNASPQRVERRTA